MWIICVFCVLCFSCFRDFLALVGVYCIFATLPCGVLGQVWYLIVSFPDLCRLSYLDIKDNKRKRALLLHFSGEQAKDIFDTLPNTGTGNDYAEALDKLTTVFAPKKCTAFEIYKFRQATQEANEPIDTFHNRLRKLSENC